MEAVVLGIDLGTSAIKIIAVNRQGEVLETVSEPLKLFQEQPGYSEQDPNEWFQATKRGVKRIISSNALKNKACLLYTSPSPRDATLSRMPSSA